MREHILPLIRIEASPEAATVAFTGELLGEPAVQSVRRQLEWLLDEPRRRELVLDLSEVELPTAGGLGTLVALQRDVQAAGGQLVLCNVSDQTYQVFTVTGLTRLLDIRPGDIVPA